MAVSISIEDYSETTPIVFEDDDPIYWFLFPYFEETCREVGQMVDLYGEAEFFAEELLAFFLVLEKTLADAQSLDLEMTVTVGYRRKMSWLMSKNRSPRQRRILSQAKRQPTLKAPESQ